MGAFLLASICSAAHAERVSKIFDGDTIQLQDRTTVRLIGIDTPELGRKNQAGEAYSRTSKNRLAELIAESNHEVRLSYDEDREDKYHRTLAYLTLQNGTDPAETLLHEGLATLLVIPANTARADIYAKAETDARKKLLNIWSRKDKQPVAADALRGSETGYHRVRGRITELNSSRYNHWILLDNILTVKLTRRDANAYFPENIIDQLEGSEIEVRGKLYRHRKQHRLRLRHPANLSFIAD